MGTFARSCILAATVAALLHGAPAHAQLAQSWVSGLGNDASPCTRAMPCQTFSAALSHTNAGGSIGCVDAGGFGALVITKSITIDCGGKAGGILALAPTAGIVVNGTGITVVLRGLTMDGAGSGWSGIDFRNGAALHIEASTITRFSNGIEFRPPPGVSARLVVTNSSISDNISNAVFVAPTGSGVAKVEILGSSLDNNFGSITAIANAPGSVRFVSENSSFSGNTMFGIQMAGTLGGAVNALITGAVVANNGQYGLLATGELAFVDVSSSTISGNRTGWFTDGAELRSFRDNAVSLNLMSDGAPSGTVPPQ